MTADGHDAKRLLRFLTCGSVDDGKSTLIGRLLYDTKLIFDDQLAALEKDSRKHGTTGQDIDFALLVDGLEAEREQGITIDVAFRYFATDKRKFIVADTPGHEQYTRNMATGASTADLAVLLVDARAGLLRQTHRHAFIASLLGVRHVVLAVNKMDLVDFSQARFDEIAASFDELAQKLDFASVLAIPMSARHGHNVSVQGDRMPWYDGPTLLAHLETVSVERDERARPWRMQVQWVNRPNLDFRGFAGTVASGVIRPGDPVVVATSGRQSTVRAIVAHDGDLGEAGPGDAVTLTLSDEIDVSRGDVLSATTDRPEVSSQIAAHVVWMSDIPLLPGRSYLMQAGTKTVSATVTMLKYKIDVETHAHLATHDLNLNEIGVCNFWLSQPIAFDPYAASRRTGAFILIDRRTNATVAAGMIDFGLRRASNLHHQATDIDKAARAALNNHKPAVLWFTGLSGAGKSTLSNLVERKLYGTGCHTYLIDGDNIREGLNRDLGFTAADRVENVRRVGEVSRLFVDAGIIVLVSLISPFRSDRQMVRDLFEAGDFWEVFVDTPIEVCRARDRKGLYRKADRGEIKNFTGVDSPYEPPEQPEIHVVTAQTGLEAAADEIIARLRQAGVLR